MYQETEQLMTNYYDKVMASKRLKQAKETLRDTGKTVKQDAPNILGKLLWNIVKAVLCATIAILVMPFVDAFRKRPSKKGMLDNFKRDTK